MTGSSWAAASRSSSSMAMMTYAMTEVIQKLSMASSAKPSLHTLVQNLASGVGLTHRDADDPVRQLEGEHGGVLASCLFHQREQLCVSAGEGTQHEELRGVHGKRIRGANLQAEVERLRGQCLGVGEPSLPSSLQMSRSRTMSQRR